MLSQALQVALMHLRIWTLKPNCLGRGPEFQFGTHQLRTGYISFLGPGVLIREMERKADLTFLRAKQVNTCRGKEQSLA